MRNHGDPMRVWFDTEFLDSGAKLELISIGCVREDGAELYLENSDFDLAHATPWLREHVVPKLTRTHDPEDECIMSLVAIGYALHKFAGQSPEFWAYYCSYDWVLLSRCYGRMLDMPHNWPHYCNDIKQLLHMAGNPKIAKLPESHAHNALVDARWARDTHLWLEKRFDFTPRPRAVP